MNVVYVDGSGSAVPGQKSRICIVFDDDEPIIKSFGAMTNNQAEYAALIEALNHKDCENKTIFTDSQLLVGHLTQGWKVNAEHLKPLRREAGELLAARKCKLEWISRRENKAGLALENSDE
jgi:ribonuclease HI